MNNNILYYFVICLSCFSCFKFFYELYKIHKLTHFDEKCFSFKKIIVDKFNINSYHDNNYYINSQTDIQKFMKNNFKCIFFKFNPNSHLFNNEMKSEIVFKCYC